MGILLFFITIILIIRARKIVAFGKINNGRNESILMEVFEKYLPKKIYFQWNCTLLPSSRTFLPPDLEGPPASRGEY